MREARHLARCPACREARPGLRERLRSLTVSSVTRAEQDRLWRGIRAEIEEGQTRRVSEILSRLRGLARRRPMLAWAPALAAAILLLLAPLHLGREERVLSQAKLNAQTTIEQIEAGLATSVLFLETPAERLSVIWVMEPSNLEGSS